jgi:UDP-N-acetylmuramoyl-tripeptide--D-alanyl-D-alanine ligase
MGMRGEGHIRYLCEIAAPSLGVLINIGSAHLGMLGSAEAIALAKGEILEGLPTDGVAIVNGDDAAVMEQVSRTAATVMTFGTGPLCDVRATDLRLDGRACPAFTLHHSDRAVPVALLLHGEHSVQNALAAAAVGVTVGVPIEEIASALGVSTPQSRWRMEVRESEEGWIIVNDTYNANPDSMRAALEVLASMSSGRRSWAVLGEMKELGETAEAEHEAIGRLVCDLGITWLVGIGEGARPMERACRAVGSVLTEATWVATPDEAIILLRNELTPGDVVLVKASRSIGLERLAAALESGGQL